MKEKVNLKDGRTIKRYSESFKLQVLEELQAGRKTKNEICRLYGIGAGSLYGWMKKYGRFDLYNPTIELKMPSEKHQIDQLKAENTKLKEALVQLQLKHLKAECDLEAAKELLGISAQELEKKSAASPSKKRLKKGKDSWGLP